MLAANQPSNARLPPDSLSCFSNDQVFASVWPSTWMFVYFVSQKAQEIPGEQLEHIRIASRKIAPGNLFEIQH
jgi:hypothetical protein